MVQDLAGKLALVTGAGQGIGRAVATGLAKRGAHVVATDLVDQTIGPWSAILRAEGLSCDGRKLDVGDPEAVEMLVDELELESPIDLLANIAGPLELYTPSLDDDAWRRTIRVYTDGVFHVSRSVAQRMKLRGRGAIAIVVPSAAGVPRPQQVAFAASRAAAHMFAKGLATELADYHVGCAVWEPYALQHGRPQDTAQIVSKFLAARVQALVMQTVRA